jgi:hypothetical protein
MCSAFSDTNHDHNKYSAACKTFQLSSIQQLTLITNTISCKGLLPSYPPLSVHAANITKAHMTLQNCMKSTDRRQSLRLPVVELVMMSQIKGQDTCTPRKACVQVSLADDECVPPQEQARQNFCNSAATLAILYGVQQGDSAKNCRKQAVNGWLSSLTRTLPTCLY